MPVFSPQHYAQSGRKLGVPEDVLSAALDVADRISAASGDHAVVFTLGHLAALSGVPYMRLREWVGRRGSEPYREWLLAKTRDRSSRPKGPKHRMRRIATSLPGLMAQQRWIATRILRRAPRHPASSAFHPGASVVNAARLHCGCRWLIKMDVEDFFDSIYEPAVFAVFVAMGYPPLLAFEMTRLCTRIVPAPVNGPDVRRRSAKWTNRGPAAYARLPDRVAPVVRSLRPTFSTEDDREDDVEADRRPEPQDIPLPVGSLPQGAPTSPMLANLVSRPLDDAVAAIAKRHGMVYTRYADDVALSTIRPDFDRAQACTVAAEVRQAMEKAGMRPHRSKTKLVPPGARKIVLGLQVDGPVPRLSRKYRNKLRLHAHILGTRGIAPSSHAAALGFRSVLAMRRHIEGKIGHARLIEPIFADTVAASLASIDWTL